MKLSIVVSYSIETLILGIALSPPAYGGRLLAMMDGWFLFVIASRRRSNLSVVASFIPPRRDKWGEF